MSLHTKYRPQFLDEVFGNDDIKQSLESIIEREKDKPHTYMFMGPAGCGKTTLARLMAVELGCDPDDIIELNISNQRGIETARDIIEKAKYSPQFGPYKAYILDEIHKSTNEFANAMLKVLEEPPDHVFFFLCTTDPDKVLKTVYKRCTKFEVGRLSDEEIQELLKWVIENEEKNISKTVIDKIIETVEGVPREALIVLGKIIDLKDEDDQLRTVGRSEIHKKQTLDLCRALIDKKTWKVISGILQTLDEDPETVRRAVLGYMEKVLLKGNHHAAIVMECFEKPFFNTGKPGLTLACYRTLD